MINKLENTYVLIPSLIKNGVLIFEIKTYYSESNYTIAAFNLKILKSIENMDFKFNCLIRAEEEIP